MLNKRKHKSFNYKSRYSKIDEIDKASEHASKQELFKNKRTGSQRKTSSKLLVLLVLLGIIIAVLYYLETQIG